MPVLFLLASVVSAAGPDLAAIDHAVTHCDAKTMSQTFAAEPQRRRSFAIAAFVEQQQIVEARQALAAQRLAPPLLPAPVGAGVVPPPSGMSDLDRQGALLAERQHELDDSRMLETMRNQALDMMRQQYVSQCSGGKHDASN